MKDYLKIILILCAGITISASPYLPANPSTQAMLAALARKKAGVGGGSPTDWTADPSIVAYYYFEGAATHAGMGVSGTGDNHADDATLLDAPAIDAVNFKEGAQSADPTQIGTPDDGLILAQASMTADFPCNGTGDGEITVAGWIRPGENDTNYILTVSDSGLAAKIRMFRDAATNIRWRIDGSSQINYTSTAGAALSAWTFVAGVYSDAANEVYVYIREEGAGSSSWETAAADVGTLDDIGAGGFFSLGTDVDAASTSCWQGQLDGWAVFNGKAFTQSELDGVFNDAWDGGGWDN